jgi:hypothetical protein
MAGFMGIFLVLQWAPLNRITLGHEHFDSNNQIVLAEKSSVE